MADIYERLREKIDKISKGYPATESGVERNLLKEFFSTEDAEFYLAMEDHSYLTPTELASRIGEDHTTVANKMEDMAQRGLLFRLRGSGEVKYQTLPVIHGFYEFNLNNLTPTITKNFSRYFKGGLASTFYSHHVPLFRSIPLQSEVVSGQKVLPLDDALAIIKSKKIICVTDCFCRSQARMAGRGCNHPLETCLVFDYFAEYYLENNIGNTRYLSADEAIEIINRCDSEGLVRLVANSQNPEVMCSCCSCCCGQLATLKLFGGTSQKVMSNYSCQKDESLCTNDGICVERCPVGAHKMVEGKVEFKQEICIGCGLCVTTCPTNALVLLQKPKEEVYFPTSNTILDTYDVMSRERKVKGD